jgi:quinohemoprotein ethanol dehydrogenase
LLSSSTLSIAASGGKEMADPGNWPSHGDRYHETGYSSLEEINTGNIAKLSLAWSLDLPGKSTLEATPLAIDGVLYFTGSYAVVYAVDAASGKLLWILPP